MDYLNLLPLTIIAVMLPVLMVVRRRVKPETWKSISIFCYGWLAALWTRELLEWLFFRNG